MSGPEAPASLATLLVMTSPIVVPPLGPSVSASTTAPESRSSLATATMFSGSGPNSPVSRPRSGFPAT